ncbi:N-acetylmuramoyl-L-alanine amidase family protein [Extibacter muris]|uniref:N-acetylmuramoyl-L-alanine amidase family protein n=1 Tax=Extibacter muris TaxID=1796622 RepID=UPI001D072E55|nr:N-acetylmuramoyl-L-alanine amidase [Extibacter muris]MCB6201284.1 N-acetylmuramoyl-L-alanine amidase [Extibacter muris]MCQ4664543.1 N-acetylmuramoyl-L-alanine amidase [Extibacter muris]MCQ4693816.1 N-acetylmuramoyl-L-alanine amidase [Extibacter muris]
MRKKVEFLLLVLLLAGLITVSRNIGKYVSGDKVEKGKHVVVIDSGHGGNDPGKIGVNDANEKDINLAIAKKVEKRLKKNGIEVVMTRKDDTTLAKEGDSNKKVQDMKARVQLINETKPAMVVSIHQNSYQDADIRGAQVFYYSHSKEGENTAELMQKALLAVDKDNTRQAKANDTYYLLKRTEVPTIIVECGFLSNPEEAAKLVTEEYQDKLADAIVQGIQTCLSQ